MVQRRCRNADAVEDRAKGPKRLVAFPVERTRPVVGDREPGVTLA